MKDTVQEIVFPRIISEDTLLRSPFDINSRIFEKNTHFNFTEKRGGQSVVCILHFWKFSYFLLPTSSSIKSAYKYTYTYLWVIVLHNKEFGSNASIRCRARRCSHFSQGFHYSVQS